MKTRLLFVLFVFFLNSCNYFGLDGHKYDEGKLPDTPQNIKYLNSEYDDYNSALPPTLGDSFPIVFSTNRSSKGTNFDLQYNLLQIIFDRDNAKLTVKEHDEYNLDVYITNKYIANAPRVVNTSSDEFGPYLIDAGRVNKQQADYSYYTAHYLLFSSGIDGNLDIYISDNTKSLGFSEPEKVDFLNSQFDDSYPSLNSLSKELVFSSNREGDYNIYSIKNKDTSIFEDLFKDNENKIIKNEVLSSQFDDNCPLVYGNCMVFASNRPGGFGGYDLYYSMFENGKWSEPVNFGAKINSEYDEFRPVIRSMMFFKNDFMLFSSNRPGGLGGFDLYYVGIDKLEGEIYYRSDPSVEAYYYN